MLHRTNCLIIYKDKKCTTQFFTQEKLTLNIENNYEEEIEQTKRQGSSWKLMYVGLEKFYTRLLKNSTI